MKLRQIGTAIAGAALALSLVACGGSPAATGTSSNGSTVYKIATDTTFAPFEYAEANGNYAGIDIELLDAIAKDQGFEYKLDPVGFDAALQNVQSGQADGVIAGMSITDKRKQVFDFSEPYYNATVCAAAKSDGDVKSLDDLRGKNVAIKTGTMSASWAQSLAEQYGFTTTTFDTSDVMYQDVLAGNSVACFEDTPVMSYAITNGGVALHIIAESEETSEFAAPYGFAVNKGTNPDLIKKFNDGLANVKKDGTYDKIISKYVKTNA
ncbi:MAG: transporter substrate-binding domain-containing protein [Olsenella sp.]|nr:transporter substrate-binding domain-containing protein [Olsenella sp.]